MSSGPNHIDKFHGASRGPAFRASKMILSHILRRAEQAERPEEKNESFLLPQ